MKEVRGSYWRHSRFLQHSTPRRWSNLILGEARYRLGLSHARGLPPLGPSDVGRIRLLLRCRWGLPVDSVLYLWAADRAKTPTQKGCFRVLVALWPPTALTRAKEPYTIDQLLRAA